MADAFAEGSVARIPKPPASEKPDGHRPGCSGRRLVPEAKVSAGSLEELTMQHKQRFRARERLHGPALAFSRQTSEGSDDWDLEFLFGGSESSN
eukprot:Skav229106  [mRNA]  locus=scaffold92:640514:654812:+ [translate_table: standard]